jgi:hypothetical protein
MAPTMLYLPPPESGAPRRLSGWRRGLATASHPIMMAVLLLSCLWMQLWPKKRPMLKRLRSRVPAEASLMLCVHVLAGVVLERWPLFVLVILGTGVGTGLILVGLDGALWGVGAAVVGASLAPVVADDVPPSWFRGRGGRR